MTNDVDSIFRERFRGAVNIRGIRYQILYSLLRAFELYRPDNSIGRVRLEGIEDLDLLGFHIDREYVQVKSAQDPWNWSRLKPPIENFLGER